MIVFVESIQIYQLLYAAFMFFTFDMYIEELKFEVLRDFVHKKLKANQNVFDEAKINIQAEHKLENLNFSTQNLDADNNFADKYLDFYNSNTVLQNKSRVSTVYKQVK